jgi:hypothetical protein
MLHLGRVGKDTISIKKITVCIPQEQRPKVTATITELLKLEIIDKTPDDKISIRRERRDDVCRLLDPVPDPVIKSIKPIEETIPRSFENTPFLVTHGSHRVKGVIDTYAFHKSKSNSKIVVYLVSDNRKKSTINLGSIHHRNSLYRRGLLAVDTKFGTKVFTKAMMNQLGPSIVGNRQPTKALIDIMIYEGYLIQIDEKRFMRTPKPPPAEEGLVIER